MRCRIKLHAVLTKEETHGESTPTFISDCPLGDECLCNWPTLAREKPISLCFSEWSQKRQQGLDSSAVGSSGGGGSRDHLVGDVGPAAPLLFVEQRLPLATPLPSEDLAHLLEYMTQRAYGNGGKD
jgi:hypothetical protein